MTRVYMAEKPHVTYKESLSKIEFTMSMTDKHELMEWLEAMRVALLYPVALIIRFMFALTYPISKYLIAGLAMFFDNRGIDKSNKKYCKPKDQDAD